MGGRILIDKFGLYGSPLLHTTSELSQLKAQTLPMQLHQ